MPIFYRFSVVTIIRSKICFFCRFTHHGLVWISCRVVPLGPMVWKLISKY